MIFDKFGSSKESKFQAPERVQDCSFTEIVSIEYPKLASKQTAAIGAQVGSAFTELSVGMSADYHEEFPFGAKNELST